MFFEYLLGCKTKFSEMNENETLTVCLYQQMSH